eukprot:TRINITY_DN652_c3_g1_i1.p1 TRINITY_DN652_c3_g1~~TRINITY_DN652_c3_g1_i1.p1  ORF type:complete len:381 (+),score=151.20 TRINITY_DN652_c3_g1_i1:51-1193(+)
MRHSSIFILLIIISFFTSFFFITPNEPKNIDFKIKVINFAANFIYFFSGVGENQLLPFNRFILNRLPKTPATNTFIEGVKSQDLFLPSAKENGIGFASNKVPVRVFLPESIKQKTNVPTLIWIHGGGFALGSAFEKETDKIGKSLCLEMDAIVISIDYGLAPENKFPVAIEECFSVLYYLLSKSKNERIEPLELVDTSRLIVGGDSAGGNLAAVLTLMFRDWKLNHPNNQLEGNIIHQILVYPGMIMDKPTPSGLRFKHAYLIPRFVRRWFKLQYLDIESADLPVSARNRKDNYDDSYISPLLAKQVNDLPSAHFILASHDPITDEAIMYAQKLQSNGVTVTVDTFEETVHGFFSMSFLEDTTKAIKKVAIKARQVIDSI